MQFFNFFFVFAVCVKECYQLVAVRVWVPPAVERGKSVILSCEHSLEGEALYAVKWYRGGEEFYRYVPKHVPPKHAYTLPGIRVDLSASDAGRVTLRGVSLQSTGIYRCEVSAEAPSFSSAAGEGHMMVYYIPREGPRISVVSQIEEDSLLLNCTSGRSYPAATLHWSIDGEKVESSWSGRGLERGLARAWAALRVRRRQSARCVQTLVLTMPHQILDVKEASVSVRSKASSIRCSTGLLSILIWIMAT